MQSDSQNLPQPQAFKLRQACAYLGGLSTDFVRGLVKDRVLKHLPECRHIVITKSSLDAYLARADRSLVGEVQ